MRLSDHFDLADFTFSETALRYGIDQSKPPQHVIANLQELAYMLEDVQRVTGYPLLLNSVYRNERTNRLVGGSRNSAHLNGLAADIRCPAFGSALELCRTIGDTTLKWDQCIHEHGSWMHISIDPRNRRMLLTKKKGNHYISGLF